MNIRPGAPDEFLEALRQHAIEAIPPELLCDRRDIWDGEPVDGEVPEWMYLRGEALESHKHFHHWCKVIKEDLQCYDRACQSFTKLFNMNPSWSTSWIWRSMQGPGAHLQGQTQSS